MKLDELLDELHQAAPDAVSSRQVEAASIAQALLVSHDMAADDADSAKLTKLAKSIRARRKAIERELLECVQAEGKR